MHKPRSRFLSSINRWSRTNNAHIEIALDIWQHLNASRIYIQSSESTYFFVIHNRVCGMALQYTKWEECDQQTSETYYKHAHMGSVYYELMMGVIGTHILHARTHTYGHIGASISFTYIMAMTMSGVDKGKKELWEGIDSYRVFCLNSRFKCKQEEEPHTMPHQ